MVGGVDLPDERQEEIKVRRREQRKRLRGSAWGQKVPEDDDGWPHLPSSLFRAENPVRMIG